MAYVYQHIREDSNTIFYIGIGENDKNNFKRAYSKYDRNKYWRNITNKISWKVEILHKNLTWEQACALEINYIQKYGRVDLQTGLLCNMTDGGNGGRKLIFTEEMKIKQRQAKSCKIIFGLSPEGEIKEFPSVNNAAQTLKIHKNNILACLKGKYNFIKGWKFSNTKQFTLTVAKRKTNTSGFTGIIKIGNKFRVSLTINKKYYQTKLYKSLQEAIEKRNSILIKNNL